MTDITTAISSLDAGPRRAPPAPARPPRDAVASGAAPGERTSGGRVRFDDLVALRLDLQKRASRTLRRHLVRGARRFGVLVLADLASFALMRAALRAVRDAEVLGAWVAELLRDVLPRGLFNGWQFAAAVLLGLLVTGNYGPGDHRRSPGRLFAGTALATALPLWMTIWTSGVEVVALQFALVTTLVWLGLVAERLTVDRVVGVALPHEDNASPALFVGCAEACREAMRRPPFLNGEFRSVGFVDMATPAAPDARGSIKEFAAILAGTHAEAVVCCGHLPDADFRDVTEMALAAGCHVLGVPRAVEVAWVQPTVVWYESEPLIELVRPTLQGWQLLLKRAMDLLGATVGLVVFAPVLALIAIAVRLETPGPVFFRQRRLGRNGRPFGCLKFRSMHADAEQRLRADPALYAEYVANNYKLAEARDPRLTRVGRFLRQTSLDELPQLWNVWRGEMSLVGPRPIVPEELKEYGTEWAPLFLSIRPGMTGAWQVRGRSRVGYPDRAAIELDYVRNWSVVSDVAILLRTVPAVLTRSGAY